MQGHHLVGLVSDEQEPGIGRDELPGVAVQHAPRGEVLAGIGQRPHALPHAAQEPAIEPWQGASGEALELLDFIGRGPQPLLREPGHGPQEEALHLEELEVYFFLC